MSLTQTELDGLTQRLRERRIALVESLDRELASETIDAEPHDRSEESIAHQTGDLLEARHVRERGELADINAALHRINEQDYGFCIACGIDIPVERLRAYPTAKRCRPCQERHERH